jgi:signal transduction histidine kinase
LTSENGADLYRDALTEIDFAANSMKRIVDDLLFLARADNESLRIDRKPLLASRLIETAISEASKNWPGVRATADVDPNLEIRVDPHYLHRLILNLLDNAMRHTPPSRSIRVFADLEESQFVLKVEDKGEGIAPEHLPHVFERFYRVDVSRSREAGGAGLGLSICESIARAHSGDIRIESELGCGTTVTVILPNVLSDPTEEEGPATLSVNDDLQVESKKRVFMAASERAGPSRSSGDRDGG